MPFEITIRRWFAASHQLRLADGSLEPLHGHNWQVRLVVARAGAGLDDMGTVHDFHDIERRLDAVLGECHNAHLNDVAGFRTLNPSAEHVARYVAQSVRLPQQVRVVEVEVWETPDCSATFRP